MCSGFLGCLDKWQTLIAGILALIAGGGAIWSVLVQTRSQREEHNDLLKRKRFAARAQMSDTLSALAEFVRQCVEYLDGRRENAPERPTDAITVLKSAIEFVDTQPSKKIFELVSFYQVHNARLFSDRQRGRTEAAAAQAYYDAAKLYFYVDRLFDYARNLAETVTEEPTRLNMVSAFRSAVQLAHYVGNESTYQGAREMIDRRHEP
jgi:hypothetical protein